MPLANGGGGKLDFSRRRIGLRGGGIYWQGMYGCEGRSRTLSARSRPAPDSRSSTQLRSQGSHHLCCIPSAQSSPTGEFELPTRRSKGLSSAQAPFARRSGSHLPLPRRVPPYNSLHTLFPQTTRLPPSQTQAKVRSGAFEPRERGSRVPQQFGREGGLFSLLFLSFLPLSPPNRQLLFPLSTFSRAALTPFDTGISPWSSFELRKAGPRPSPFSSSSSASPSPSPLRTITSRTAHMLDATHLEGGSSSARLGGGGLCCRVRGARRGGEEVRAREGVKGMVLGVRRGIEGGTDRPRLWWCRRRSGQGPRLRSR